MEKWLNIIELAEKTKIPDTTIRRYIAKFSQFFLHKGGTRSRRYESSAADVLLRIKALYDNGYESEEVANALGEEFPVVVDGGENEMALHSSKLPALATAEDMSDLREALAKHTELNRLLLQNQHEQNEVMKKLIQDNEEQKQFNELLIKALSNKEQQEINQKLLQELAESKQRDQLILERLIEKKEEKEEQKEVVAKPSKAKKKGFWKKFFK